LAVGGLVDVREGTTKLIRGATRVDLPETAWAASGKWLLLGGRERTRIQAYRPASGRVLTLPITIRRSSPFGQGPGIAFEAIAAP
jgi:hypothetical protein